MKFATLFLIASVVLALPTGDSSANTVELAKKDTTPTYELHKSQKIQPVQQTIKRDVEEVQKDIYKDPIDNNGVSCSLYANAKLSIIPEECMKPIFCNRNRLKVKIFCHNSKLETWTKESLLKKVNNRYCIHKSICGKEDYYNGPNFILNSSFFFNHH